MIQIHVSQYLHYIQRISYMFKRVSDDNHIHKFHLFSVVRQKHSVFFAMECLVQVMFLLMFELIDLKNALL